MTRPIPHSATMAEVRKDLQPMVTLFSSLDGGYGIARLQHGLLDEIYEKETHTPEEVALIKLVKRFSIVCAQMLKRPK